MITANSCTTLCSSFKVHKAIILGEPAKVYSTRLKDYATRPKGSAVCSKCDHLLAKPNAQGCVAGQIKCNICKTLNEVA